MSEPIHFTVYGSPIAQPRHRVTVRGKHAHAYVPGSHSVHDWKDEIIRECRKHAQPFLIEGPIRLEYAFWMPRPKAHYGTGKNAGKLKHWAEKMIYHIKKPDEDNLCKALKDAITDSGAIWLDDCQVCRGGRRDKSYIEAGKMPRVYVIITPL